MTKNTSSQFMVQYLLPQSDQSPDPLYYSFSVISYQNLEVQYVQGQ
ncbi:MAG: hypothetical protein VSS75_033100 [Candidatus Parabeggiatoa sp.]|nr:hypothetical protein [Candidatus Parabeggiatoa sp.]